MNDQIPFEAAEFADNPEQRCPCILLLDTSASMTGGPIDQLNAGLSQFREETAHDSLASRRVEVAIVTFGPVKADTPFLTVDQFYPPILSATGDTPMGAAIEYAVKMLRDRKDVYKKNSVSYFRPWIFLITDGSPTDNWANAARLIKEGEDKKEFMFFAVGIESADMKTLSEISVRTPLKLKGLQFKELFSWLSNSLSVVSHSNIDDIPQLVNPAAPDGWAVAG